MGHHTDPARTAARRATRERRLGTDPACALCGTRDIDTLTRSRIEEHHLMGRALDAELTVPLCLNCHAIVSTRQSDADVLAKPTPDNLLERLVRMLRSTAAFFETFTDWLARFADQLAVLVDQLDSHCHGWRDLPGAKP